MLFDQKLHPRDGAEQVCSKQKRMSFLEEGLPPVEAVVGSMCEGQDGWVHQLPDPRVTLLLARTETQVGDLQEGKRLSSAAIKAE